MEAGRELDIRIGEKIFNYEVDQEFDQPSVKALRDQYDEWGILPFYSTDMNDAMLIAPHFNNRIVLYGPGAYPNEDTWKCEITTFPSNTSIEMVVASAPTAPLAICLAALKAIA